MASAASTLVRLSATGWPAANGALIDAITQVYDWRAATVEHSRVTPKPGLAHTDMYLIETGRAKPHPQPRRLAPSGAGSVHVVLTGEAAAADRLHALIHASFRCGETTPSEQTRQLSFTVYPEDAPPDAVFSPL
ncbi:hypothetical protein GXW83_20660 [Streptacidiphilus sp. PB12-B1b]|uniref:hypothetical protein n=1 Tax=Streptacidiphilus sp. PB12-B1b TaxID=2705012 RepID=UPI0015FAD2CA|nr:hypothetical protein [Streptacidiphilus sp. PB12-B1b]QMU77745.1 hypothetical protein GXW83_20660 [Streptacidiphilus sp. PB12-B1b]